MANTELKPDKITHPFQLMAAWFVMLILLDGVLLGAACKIENPPWAASVLVIAACLFPTLAMTAVFVMLTKFRPHLQSASEYAEWLKDERSFRGQAVETLEIKEVVAIPRGLSKQQLVEISETSTFKQIATHPVEVVDVTNADKVLGALRRLGFNADLYVSSFHNVNLQRPEKPDSHRSIWIGSRVPALVAVLAIKTVVRIWPHLCYLHLSSDGVADAPDYVHDELFFGGSTSTAKRYGLLSWTLNEIEGIADQISDVAFHKIIRDKYKSDASSPFMDNA